MLHTVSPKELLWQIPHRLPAPEVGTFETPWPHPPRTDLTLRIVLGTVYTMFCLLYTSDAADDVSWV